jgi:signal peptidase I
MRKLIAAILGMGVLVAALAQGRLFKRYVVEGRSMLRAYAPGDRLVVEGVSYRFRQPRIGEVVVLRPPAGDGRLDLKRIAAGPGAEVTVQNAPDFLGKNEWYLLGDNLDESTDSREIGPVKSADIVGRVWFKY